MPKFSSTSHARLNTCHPDLQAICDEIIQFYDFTVIQGHRTPEDHAQYIKDGTTTVAYEKSKHSHMPSLAVDIAPYNPRVKGGVDWNDKDSFHLLAGIMFGIAKSKGIKIRWGGDWNRNWNLKDQKFFDLPHFELVM